MWANGQVRKSAVFIALIVALPHCYGQKLSFGSCPQVTSKTGITLAGITGAYNVDVLTPSLQWHGWNCMQYDFTALATTATDVTFKGIQKLTGNALSTKGRVVVLGTDTTSGVDTTLGITNFHGLFPKTYQYNIIRVTTPAAPILLVLYSCKDTFPWKIEDVLVLYKTTVTAADLDTARTSLQSLGYPLHYLRRGYDGC